jgi:hypothetical protein
MKFIRDEKTYLSTQANPSSVTRGQEFKDNETKGHRDKLANPSAPMLV